MNPRSLTFLMAFILGCGGSSIEPKQKETPTIITIPDGTNNSTNNSSNNGSDHATKTNNSVDDEEHTSTNNQMDEEDQTEDPPDPAAPRILRFDANVQKISEGDSVRFTAVVTDPDGIEDLIGGTLSDAQSGTAYGSFTTAAEEGSYSLTLTWSELNDVEWIQFADSEERSFEAEFYDVAGHTTTETLSIELHCYGYSACNGLCGFTACDGYCIREPLDTRDHCGTCGNECAPGAFCDTTGDTAVCACPDREEICNGECTAILDDPDNCGSCGNVCAVRGCNRGLCGCNDESDCAPGAQCGHHRLTLDSITYSCLLFQGVRLRGGGKEGFVEVNIGGTWVPLCGSSYAPDLVCQELFGTDAVSHETRDTDDRGPFDPVFGCHEATTLDECSIAVTRSCDGWRYVTCA